MDNFLELKTIHELNEFSFFIPSYQRGYRWTSKEVLELLNDINDFTPRIINDANEKTWYCLQPIVVKKREGATDYETIDGQQRLTTIYLILYYLNQDFVIDKRDKLFDIDYQTREDIKNYLHNLGDNNSDSRYIDYHYIREAYLAIIKWFEDRPNNFDKGDFRSKFKFHSKVIWYESNDENPISIFTRINIGKIPLTNSELIKALFLNSSNFDKSKHDKLRLKQLEIASEWDQIEHSLQNNRFWYFLTGNNSTTNRIEFIFDLMNTDDNKGNDAYSTFRFFSRKFNNKTPETIAENWHDVKDYFQRFNEWYNERELYHKIGYLIYINSATIKELYLNSVQSKKSEFKAYLDGLIKGSLRNISLEDLQYGDKNVKKVLLLYNILTMLNTDKDNSYFPFDIFRNESWDIEHITSVKDTLPDKNRDQWLKDAVVFIDESKVDGNSLKQRAEVIDVSDNEGFKELFEDIISHFNSEINDEDINDLSNLTLLDSETNRGYKNAVFPIKRKTIINRDKSGIFIPICTKNVFLKYFSEYPPKISFWTQDDREKYEEDLYKVLNIYLNN